MKAFRSLQKKWSKDRVSILSAADCIHREQEQKMPRNVLLLKASVNTEM